jgi:hypothetical protein
MFGNDEEYYACAAAEIANGEVRQGLWAKALAETGYDGQRARARYLKLRVKALKVEVAEGRRLVRGQERAMERQAEERDKQGALSALGTATAIFLVALVAFLFLFGLVVLADQLGWRW